ncbi:xanthine dehydrogenase family protein subunit M [Caldilinea sp.]|uniref:FAD binding domain-containing protein n=1 Tax=Caldilinea sp. TaxID=2293560 RepID=UPI0021DDED8D|nr:xanthine dehydrogenase family protein subunit M [Caldilinea sp.]GIV67289.1 MAG: oxidoreductase [Caldilinea sp.]
MQAFRYIRAQNAEHAAALLLQQEGRARILAGGTDLIVALRERRIETDLVIDIKGIPEVEEIAYSPTEGLRIGAATPCYRIYRHPDVIRRYPGIVDAASLIGGIQIQGRASFGGNLCNASPAADSIPALIVHSAVCEIARPQGRRRVPAEEFCVAPGRTVLGKGEFLVSLHLPSPPPRFGGAYLRFIPRNEMDIAIVGVGAAVQLDESRRRIVAARVALGAVAPTPLFVPEAGEALIGAEVGEEAFAQAAAIAQAAARPITDMRGTAEFRRHLVGVLTRRALAKAVERATQTTE